jgi:alditol oxidase
MSFTFFCADAIGFALPNLAALGEISVGGIATGVHGSGLEHQALASQMLSMELVMANGNVATFRKDDPEWNALAVGFGAFGVVTKIEFKLIPTFNVATYVFMKFIIFVYIFPILFI